MKQKIFYQQLICIIIGATLLLFEAIQNGFPIVYSDTSTYIITGFTFETPFDRPITYGLFVRLFSGNGLSLWGVIIAQALIVSTLLTLVLQQFFDKKYYLPITILVITILTFCTSISWVVCLIMPDIFTAIGFLCVVLILFTNLPKGIKILLYTLFFISVAMHMSHIVMFALFIFTLFIFQKFIFKNLIVRPNQISFIVLFLLSVGAIFTMGSAISKSKHVFFMGAMVEHGILKTYLHNECANHQYKLCEYKDSLPVKAYQFIWDKESVLHKVGGWKESKKEFTEIINNTITTPKYIGLHIIASLKATWQQFLLFKIGDGNTSFLQDSELFQRVEKFLPKDVNQYLRSNQNTIHFKMIDFKNLLYTIVVLFCILINVFIVFKKNIYKKLISFLIVIILGIIINAWDSATFGNAIDRLGCKTIWLLPMVSIISLISYFFPKMKINESVISKNNKLNL
jgi:hypothetical protein